MQHWRFSRGERQDSQSENLGKLRVLAILDGWEKDSPGRRQVMFRSLMNVRPPHLPDPKQFDFAGLE